MKTIFLLLSLGLSSFTYALSFNGWEVNFSPEDEVAKNMLDDCNATNYKNFIQKHTHGSPLYKVKCDLSGADLRNADLSGMNLVEVLLEDADLSGADLSGALLYGAFLAGATLAGANLTDANLYFADLENTDLTGANLTRTFLRNTDLTGAIVDNVMLRGTVVNQSHVKIFTQKGLSKKNMDIRVDPVFIVPLVMSVAQYRTKQEYYTED